MFVPQVAGGFNSVSCLVMHRSRHADGSDFSSGQGCTCSLKRRLPQAQRGVVKEDSQLCARRRGRGYGGVCGGRQAHSATRRGRPASGGDPALRGHRLRHERLPPQPHERRARAQGEPGECRSSGRTLTNLSGRALHRWSSSSAPRTPACVTGSSRCSCTIGSSLGLLLYPLSRGEVSGVPSAEHRSALRTAQQALIVLACILSSCQSWTPYPEATLSMRHSGDVGAC